MKSMIYRLHQLFNEQLRLQFPFNESQIPKNGIYIIFEKGEKFEDMDRIVRVGTHTGDNQLLSRLKQHFIHENKNRSIFRKNIGRCLLNGGSKNLANQDYIKAWDLDTTERKGREEKQKLIDVDFEKSLEKAISDYIQNNLSFTVFEVADKKQRLFWEQRITSTLSNATKSGGIKTSENWLGNVSTKDKIKESGLWQVQELFKENLTEEEFTELVKLVK